MNEIFNTEIDYSIVMHILASMLVGFLIGIEREWQHKPTGLRTLMLVTMGSCLFTIISLSIGSQDRIAANIITGIGFIGAGAMYRDESKVTGLTSAATIWICAALGMAIGSGRVLLAVFGTVITIIVLHSLKVLENYLENKRKTKDLMITFHTADEACFALEKKMKEFQLSYSRISRNMSNDCYTIRWKLQGAKTNLEKFSATLIKEENIKSFTI
ncbi:MAG: MgtC/SapB family protein [Cytophagaceae bacterium]